jgi:hypothetical protein
MALDACHAVLEQQKAAKKSPQATPQPTAQPTSGTAPQPAPEPAPEPKDDDEEEEEEKETAPAPMPAPPQPQVQEAAPAAGPRVFPDNEPWVFDARGDKPKQSIAFGLRLYQALREFSLHDKDGVVLGTRYSTNASPDLIEIYQSAFKDRLKPENAQTRFTEWPSLSAFPFLKPVKDAKFKAAADVHKFGGITWAATGFTNCSNSQMAAFYVACRGTTLAVEGPGPKLGKRTYNLGDDGQDRTIKVFKDVEGPWKFWDADEERSETPSVSVRAAVLFNSQLALSQNYDKRKGGAYNALRALGIGDAVPLKGNVKLTIKKKTVEKPYEGEYHLAQELLREAFIGDWGNFTAHAWLVGEIRYRVTLEESKQPVFCDQSSFCDPHPCQPGGPKWEMPILFTDEPKARMVQKKDMLTDEQLKWIAENEDEFTGRVRKFLEGGRRDVLLAGANGAKSKVNRGIKEVKVHSFGAFTSNPTWAEGFGGKHPEKGFQLSITLSGRHCWLKDDKQPKFAAALQDKKDLPDQIKVLKDKKKPSDDEIKKIKELEDKLEKATKEYKDLAFPRDNWVLEGSDVKDSEGMVDRGITNALDKVSSTTKISLARFYARKK